ncbi:hypothetical protein [Pseudalkalibacillus caeni]|uniref:Uncharacterized protein n=1 Tax=Exobacillus caeni TaxID=2574798 RepID=A0A5R9F0J5_9BACL|nr:hypothetical protein [Pseudalkalibacillus caeni]TLS37057.1 hypothetical protein FCL54_11035 [Pseudalkalibacillus caeni]
MPKTLPGKLSALFLLVFIMQIILFLVSVLSNNGFGAIVTFIQLAPFTALLGIIFGIIGTARESGKGRSISIATVSIGSIFAGIAIFFMFIWSFGG